MRAATLDDVIAVWIPGKTPTKNRVGFQKGRSFNPCAQWESDAGLIATAELNRMGIRSPAFPHQPVEFRLIVFFDDITRFPTGKSNRMLFQKPGDNPNYYKAPCDAMKRVLYGDDKQIRYTANALLIRSESRDRPGSSPLNDSVTYGTGDGSTPLFWSHWPGRGCLINVRAVDIKTPWNVFPMKAPPNALSK